MENKDRYARRKVRELRRRFLRRNWWILALFAFFVLGVFVALAWSERLFARWIDPGLVTAFILGAGIATTVALIMTLLGMDGARSYREGLEAESWSASALDRFRKDGWFVLHDLEFKKSKMNIDHVLIGSQGVIAVETKWRSDEWNVTSTALEDEHHRPVRWLGGFIGQTERQARKLRSLLFAGGVRTDVRSVIILWGPRITGAPTVTIDGVLVGLGQHIDDWFGDIRSIALSDDQVHKAIRAVKQLKAGVGVRKSESESDSTEPATRNLVTAQVSSFDDDDLAPDAAAHQ